VESLLEEGHTNDVRALLNSNQSLFEKILEHVQSGQKLLNTLSGAATVLLQLRRFLQMSPNVPLSSIWVRAASGEMIGSPFFRETMLLIKKVPSDKLVDLLEFLRTLNETIFVIDLSAYQQELEDLVKTNKNSTPLRTQDDVRNDSMRTTVVAQKVLLSKHKAALSEQDKAYSELISKFHDDLESYFTGAFIHPHTLFLSEILMYDLKSPHTEVFQPRPRFSIERALASPHDYLGCECCAPGDERDGEAALSSTQPATTILYQMYLESGTLINASDLWSAFNAIVGEGEEDGDSKTM
jgi:origin recognition complex subunit 3